MDQTFLPRSLSDSGQALSVSEVRDILPRLPGWRAVRHGRRLTAYFHLRREEDAAACVIAALILAFGDGLIPEIQVVSRSVRVVVSEPHPWTISPRVLTFARRLSDFAGTPGSATLGPPTPALGRLVDDLTVWAGPTAAAWAARAGEAKPVAGMLSLLATLESTIRAFLPWIESAHEALTPLLPGEEEIERRAEADTLTRPMQLARDAGFLVARLDTLLALLRTAQESDPASGEPSEAVDESLLDSTVDLTPYLRPQEPSSTER